MCEALTDGVILDGEQERAGRRCPLRGEEQELVLTRARNEQVKPLDKKHAFLGSQPKWPPSFSFRDVHAPASDTQVLKETTTFTFLHEATRSTNL